jgi:ubiquinone/menaquinone biosynthesis C-methylase UbiE
MKINIGCGFKKLNGFVNIDSDSGCNPDVVLQLGKEKFPFEDNTVEYVVAHHIFEHLGDEFFDFIKDLYRVCKHEAIIEVVVPHPRHDYFLGDLSHVRAITVENMRTLSKQYCENESFINTSWSGFANVLGVDFEIFEHRYELDEVFKSIIAEIQDENQINWMARAMNNAITEIHFKMMAIK